MERDRSRVVVITGATSGIGKAAALESSAAGDHVVLVARGHGPLDRTSSECTDAGAASARTHAVDIGDDEAVAAVFTQTVAEHGRVDAVIQCAGVVAYGRTEEVPAPVFDAVLRTNLLGPVNVVRHALPIMRRQRSGTLVLVGSVIGHIAAPSMSPYVLSKWGLRALARQVQIENRDVPGVRIAYVAPGGVDTPIYAQAGNYQHLPGRPPPPVYSARAVARVLLKRLDHHRPRTQVGVSNGLLRLGFTVLPSTYDRLVGPLFTLLATAPGPEVPDTTGNVLESGAHPHEMHHGHEGILRTLGRRARSRIRTTPGGSP